MRLRWHFAGTPFRAGRSNESPLGLLPYRKQLKKGVLRDSSGFSLTELMISLVVLGILIVTVLAVFTNYLVLIARSNELIQMTNDSQNMLRIISEEVRFGAGVRTSNSISDPNAPAGGWNTDNTNFVIITAVPAIDSNEEYIIDPDTGEPYINELVYYKNGTIMLKRVLAHPDAVGNSLKTSCPKSVATPACPADKELIGTGKTMTFTLYDQNNTVTVDPLLARAVEIDLQLEKTVFGQILSYRNKVKMTLRNTF